MLAGSLPLMAKASVDMSSLPLLSRAHALIALAFHFLAHNALTGFRLLARDIGRLCSDKSATSLETPSTSAVSFTVKRGDLRTLATLGLSDDS